MIQHIVMFKFKETANGKTKAENLREAKARMMAIISWSPSSRTWKSWKPIRSTRPMWRLASL